MSSKSTFQSRRIFASGLLVWLVPFVVSLPFFDRNGQLLADIFLFKTIMILISALCGGALMLRVLARAARRPPLTGDFARLGLISGLIWLVMNWLLDVVVLLPVSGMGFGEYMLTTGLRYLAMPMTGWFMGAAMNAAVRET